MAVPESRPDPLVAALFHLDRIGNRVGLSPRAIVGLSAVGVGFVAGSGAVPMQTRPTEGWPVRLQFPCPPDARPGTALRLALRCAGARLRSGTITLAGLPDATLPTLILSRVMLDPHRGVLRANGWSAGHPATARIVLCAAGRPLADADMAQPRPDVRATRPLLPLRSGWSLAVPLAVPLLDPATPFELRLELADGRLLAAVALALPGAAPAIPLRGAPEATQPGAAPVSDMGPDASPDTGPGAFYRRLSAHAAALPRPRLERLIASEPFRRRWQRGGADAADHPWHLAREVVAEELARRLQPGDEIAIRLTDGDLVLARPVDDSILARRYLTLGHDELGFLRWITAQVGPGDTAIDVGAAYGVVSRSMARRGARVLAIEADDLAASRIRRAGLNFGAGRIDLVEAAAADVLGEAVFAGMGASSAGSGKVLDDEDPATVAAFLREVSALDQVPLSGLRAQNKARRTFDAPDISVRRVPAVTIDDCCRSHGLCDVAILKIDVEGGELLALRGAAGLLDGAFGRPPLVAFEYSNLFPTRGGRREQVLELFLSRGWTLFRLADGKNGGGGLLAVPDAAAAPAHDNLIAVPPGRSPLPLA